MLVGMIFYRQKHPASIFIGVLVGFIGTSILALAGAGGLVFNSYVFFVVLATLCYGTNVNIMIAEKKGKIRNLILLISEDEELVFLNLKMKLSNKKLGELINMFQKKDAVEKIRENIQA